jgi:hypothetical protein
MAQILTVDPSRKNEVEIIAYNGKGLLATPPFRFSIDAWGVATQERPRLFVLAAGVDKYVRKDWQLSYAVKDARAFADALKAVGSAQVDGGAMFSDVQVTPLFDAEVSERNLAAAFERLAPLVKARDVFVLFLGGHGRSIAGEGWFYLPADLDTEKGQRIETHGIGQAKLQAWMAKIPAQKRLMILDACESSAGAMRTRSIDRERETVMAQLEHATGDITISAAPEGKAAYEGYKDHGLLTYALLEALHRPAGVGQEPVSVFGLGAHISRQVPALSQRTFGVRQVPRFTPTGEDFPLGVRTAVLRETELEERPAVVRRTVLVRDRPANDAAQKGMLEEGDEIRVRRVDGSWALVESGVIEGYIPVEALLYIRRR